MPTYEIYKKDGTPVRVEGPEGASTEELVDLYLSKKKQKRTIDDVIAEDRARREAQRRETPLTIGEQFGEGIKGIGSGAANIIESGALGLATILPEERELVAREYIQDAGDVVQEYLAPDERVGAVSTDIPRKFGEALGSFGGILGTAAVNPLAAVGLVTAAGAGEASERAREGEATEEERAKASRFGAVVGASELISPLRLLRIFKGGLEDEAVDTLIKRGRRIFASAGEEGLQEFGAAVAQNLIEQGIYNPDQGTFAGTREPALYGAGVGGFVQALTDMIAPRKGGRRDVTETEDTGSGEGAPVDTQGKQGAEGPTDTTGATETGADRVVTPRTDARADTVGEGKEDVALKDTDIKKLIVEQKRIQKEQTARKERLDDPKKMEAYAKEKGISTEEMQNLTKTNYDNNQPRLEELNTYINSGEGKARLKEANAKSKAAQERMKFKDTSPKTDAAGNIIETEKEKTDRLNREMFEAKEAMDQGEGFDDATDQMSQAFSGKPKEVNVDADANKRAKDTYRLNLKDGYYLDSEKDSGISKEEAAKNLAEFNRLTSAGNFQKFNKVQATLAIEEARKNLIAKSKETGKKVTKEDLVKETQSLFKKYNVIQVEKREDALSTEDKNKIVNLVQSRPSKTVKGNANPLFRVAQVLSKDSNVEGVLDNAAFMAVRGEPTSGSDLDPGRVYFVAKGNQGIEAGKRVEEWVNANLSEEGKAWFASRKKKYEVEPKASTEGLLKPEKKKGEKKEEVDEKEADVEKGVTEKTTEELAEKDLKDAVAKEARTKEKERKKDVNKKLNIGLIQGQPPSFIGPPRKPIIDKLVRDRDKQLKEMDPLSEAVDDKGRNVKNFEVAKQIAVRQARESLDADGTPYTKKDIKEVADSILPTLRYMYDAKALAKDETAKKRAEKKKFDPKKAEQNKEIKFIKELNLKTKERRRAMARAAIARQKEADKEAAKINEENEKIGLEQLDTPENQQDILNELKLEKDAVENLDVNLDRSTIDLLVQGNLKEGLNNLAKTSTNPTIKKLATKLAEKIGTTKIEVIGNLTLNGKPVAGAFDPTTNTIFIDDSFMIPHVLFHEAAHAVTSATIANKSNPLTKRLANIFNEIKGQLDTAYGSKNLDEFVAEAFSNPQFQRTLARIRLKDSKIDALRAFGNRIANFIRGLLNLEQKEPTFGTAKRINNMIDGIIAPAPEFRDAGLLLSNMDANNTKNVFDDAIGNDQREKSYMNPQEKSSFIAQAKDFLFDGAIADGVKDFFASFADALVITDIADGIGFRDLGARLMKLLQYQRGDLERVGGIFKEKLTEVTRILKANKGLEAKLDDVIYSPDYGATIYQVDPEKPRSFYDNKIVDGNPLTEIWDKQQPKWQALGADGQKAYGIMRDHYKKEYEKIRALLYRQVEEATDTATAESVNTNVFSKLFDKEVLDVYFPLTREGRYGVTYKLKTPTPTGDSKVVVFVDTSTAKDALIADLKKNPNVDTDSIQGDKIDAIKKSFRSAPPTEFVGKVLESVGKVKDPAEKARLEEEIVRLFVHVLPESSFAKSLVARKGTPGYIGSSVQAFKTKGFSIGRQVIQLQRGKEFRELNSEIQKVVKEARGEPKKSKFIPSIERVGAELERRIEFATKGANAKEFEKLVKGANQSAFIYTIGLNASSAIVNLSQVPLVVYPYLAAEYGLGTSFKTIGKAYKMVANGANSMNEYFRFDEDTGTYVMKDKITTTLGKERDIRPSEKKAVGAFAPLIVEAEKRGQLTKSFILDALGLGETGKAYGNTLDKATGFSAIFFQGAERYNRQTTLLAAYELALRKELGDFKTSSFADVASKASQEQVSKATEKALRQSLELNGGSVLETAPRISQQGLGRIAMMYKTYGVRMYTTLFKTARELIRKDNTIQDKALAFRQLVAVHGSALFFAGVHGLPLYGAMEIVYNLLLADDDEDDFDTMVRKSVGEEYYKGAVNLITGADVASRIRLTGLLIQENRYNRDASFEENAFFYFGGPAFSTFDRVVNRGLYSALFVDGDIERDLENIAPPSIANAWKGLFGRTAREGYVTRRGDAIYGDPTFGDIAGSVFGFPPVEYTLQMEKNNIEKGVDNAINTQKSKLLRKLYVAMRQGDLDSYDDVLQGIMKHNAKHPLSAITPESIKRSLKRHMETSKNIATNKGISISSQNQDIINLREMEYDSDYNFESLFGD